MKKILISIIIFALLNIGCASQKAWIYDTNNYSSLSTQINKKVAVLPFKDSRENKNSNKMGLGFIPLFPYGWMNFKAPEGSQLHMFTGLWTNYNPKEDFSKALAEELASTNIFKEAYFDFKKGESDLVIKGEILSTDYKSKLYTYGVSFFAGYLWIVGFPTGSASNDLSVELSCIDAKTEEVLFSKKYHAEKYSKVGWIYVMPNDFNYSKMLKEIYKDFVADLRMQVSKLSHSPIEK
jgi:hypothetical protein